MSLFISGKGKYNLTYQSIFISVKGKYNLTYQSIFISGNGKYNLTYQSIFIMDILSFGIIDVLKMDTSHQRPYLTHHYSNVFML